MIRIVAVLFLLLVSGTHTFAQSGFDGKWATARKQSPELLSETERRQGEAQLELTIDGGSVKGTLSLNGLGGQFYEFNQGTVGDRKVWFRTTATSGTRKANRTWHAELVRDDTIVLWSWGLELVGENVLELMKAITPAPGATSTVQPPVPPSAATSAAPDAAQPQWSPSAAANPETFCRTHSISTCYLLRRLK